jgi:hypothetical protein
MTTSTNILMPLLELLKFALSSQYFKQPISSELDEKISSYIAELISLERGQLEAFLEKIADDNARVLGLYAERMATLAVRSNSVEPIINGLVALLIYARTEDPRDVLLVLSLLHDAAIKTAGSARKIFDEVGSVIGGVELLNGFLNRSDEDKSIGAMGYEESKSEEGFLYVRTW